MGEENNDSNYVANRIQNLSKDELEDKLARIRFEILRVVKDLGRQYKNLILWQEKRTQIEERLEELGFRQS